MDSPLFRRAEGLPKKWFSPSYLLQTHHLLTPPLLLPLLGPKRGHTANAQKHTGKDRRVRPALGTVLSTFTCGNYHCSC